MKFITITSPDVNNGTGFRVTVWVSGCTHKCKGCHNPESWNYKNGSSFKQIKDNLYDILSKEYISGVTFSGGDPLDQSVISLIELFFIIKNIKKCFPNKTIWMYTGFDLYEDICGNKSHIIKKWLMKSIIKLCDVLVDGPYIQKKRDLSLKFRGSSNQHIYEVKDINF